MTTIVIEEDDEDGLPIFKLEFEGDYTMTANDVMGYAICQVYEEMWFQEALQSYMKTPEFRGLCERQIDDLIDKEPIH